jgi:3-oxoadipate enol-lactonase
VSCPVTFLAGRYDTLVDAADMRTAAECLPGARFREFTGTHFLPLHYPELMLHELRLLAEARSALV